MERSPSSSYFEWDEEPAEQRQRRSIFGRKSQDGNDARPIIDPRAKRTSDSPLKRFGLRKRDSVSSANASRLSLQPVYESDLTPPATPSSETRSRLSSMDLLRDSTKDSMRLTTPSSSYTVSRSHSENPSARNSISATDATQSSRVHAVSPTTPRRLSYQNTSLDRPRLAVLHSPQQSNEDGQETITANTPPSRTGSWQTSVVSSGSHYVKTNTYTHQTAPGKSWLRIEETPRTSMDAARLSGLSQGQRLSGDARAASRRSVQNASKSTFYSTSSEGDEDGETSLLSIATSRTSMEITGLDGNAKSYRAMESPEPRWSSQSSQRSTPRLSLENSKSFNFSRSRPSADMAASEDDKAVADTTPRASKFPHNTALVPQQEVPSTRPAPRNFSRPNFSRPMTTPAFAPSPLPLPTRPQRTGVLASVSGSVRLPNQPVRKQASDNSVATIVPSDKKSARPRPPSILGQLGAVVTAEAAELVLLKIMANIANLKDLFAAARINKGFYNVFKRHELELMKRVLYNMSPGAWELREASPKEIIAALESPHSVYTPTRYLQFHTRDTYTLRSLKSLMATCGRSFLRMQSIEALRGGVGAARMDEALWRIWTFCTLFGAEKQREDDVVAQMNWLQGGVVVFQPTSALVDDSAADGQRKKPIDATDSFGRGNHGGLSSEQLYDMTEIWDCLAGLLAQLQGARRIDQARKFRIFVDQDPERSESELLDEWVAYVMSLGLSTILDLASAATDLSETAFVTAEDMGWTCWRAPDSEKSRRSFLREAISRLHTERLGSHEDRDLASTLRHGGFRHVDPTSPMKSPRRPGEVTVPTLGDDRPLNLWMEYMTRTESNPPVPVTTSTTPTFGSTPAYTHSSPRSPALKSPTAQPTSILVKKPHTSVNAAPRPPPAASSRNASSSSWAPFVSKFTSRSSNNGATAATAASRSAPPAARSTSTIAAPSVRPPTHQQIASSVPARTQSVKAASRPQKSVARLPSGVSSTRG